MRFIDEISKPGRKGVFLINLEYKRKSFDRQVKREFKSALSDMQSDELNKLESYTSLNDMLNINPTFKKDIIKNAMKRTYKDVGVFFAKETYKNLSSRKSDMDNITAVWERQMSDYIEKYGGERIKLITNTTEENFKRIVRNVVTESMANGLSVQDAAQKIRESIGFTNEYRSIRIARTEIVSASNQGSLNGATATKLPLKKVWIATKNKRTRHSHDSKTGVDGQVVDISDYFTVPIFEGDENVGEERMLAPGDPTASAGNVINCRCTIGYKRIL